MAVRTISTKLAIEGEAQYKKAISECNSALSMLKSSLSLVESEFRDNANSMEALTAKSSALDAVYEKQKEKVSELEKALANALKHQKDYAASAAEAGEKVAAYSAELEKLKDSAGDTQQQQAELTAEIEKWGKNQADAEAASRAAEKSVQAWQKQLNNARIDLNDLSDEIDRNNQYLEEAQGSADQCARSIDQYGREVKEAGAASEKFGRQSTGAVEALAQAFVAAGLAEKARDIAAALYDCVDTFADFEAQMSAVQAISGATGADMAALAEKAKYMGSTTAFTAAEAGQAMEYMAMAGWKTADMLDGLEGIMHLSAASGESLASTSDIVTDALTAFGLAASDSGHFADVLATASANANTNVGMMGETFKYAAPVAGALGYSIEDVALAVGLMANAGIKGSDAGTALRSTLTNLSKPSKDVAGYMEALGVSLTDSQGRMRSLSELMDILRERFSQLTEAQKAEYAAGIAGKEAMSGLLAIVNASEADYRKLTKAINDCNDAAYEMSKTKLDNYAGQVTLLESAVDGLKLAIGSQLAPALEQIASGATTAVSGLTELLEACPALTALLAGVATSAGLLAVAFAGFQILPTITSLFATFNAVLASNPLGMVAIAVAGVVAALGTLVSYCSDASDGVNELNRELEEIGAAYDASETNINATAAAAEKLIDKLSALESQESMTEGETALYAQTVDKLNALMPELNLQIDEQTGLLLGGAEAVRASTEAWKKNALAQAMQDQYQAVLSGQAEALIQAAEAQLSYNDALATFTDIERQQAEAEEELARVLEDTSISEDERHQRLAELTDLMTGLQGQYYDANSALTEQKEALDQANEAAGAFEAEIERLNDVEDILTSGNQENAKSTEEMTSRMEGLIAEIETLESAYNESYQAAMESINSQMGLFEEMDGSAKTSIDSLIETLKGQVSYLDTYGENIKKAMEMGVDQGLVKKLSDGSQESAQILDAIVKGGTEDIAALNEQFAKVEEGKKDFSTTVAQMETEFDKTMENLGKDLQAAFDEMDLYYDTFEIGKNDVQGLLDGTSALSSDLITKYREMAEAALAEYKKTVGQHSPSVKYREAGAYDIRGLIEGAESEKGHLKEAYIELAEAGTLGVAEGIAANGNKAVKAADKLAGEVYSRNKEWIDRQTKYQSLTLREQLDVWEAIQGQFIKESKQYAEAEEKIFDLKAKMQDEYYKKVEEVNKKIIKLEEAYQNEVSSRTKEIFDSYGLFDEVAAREDVSGQKLISNLQKQVESMKNFYAGLDELSARGVGDALVEEIRAMGPGAAAQLDALLDLSDLKLSEFADLYKEKQRFANQQALEELKSLREETDVQIQASLNEISDLYGRGAPAVGQSFADGLARGMLDGSPTAASAAAAVAQEAVDAAGRVMSGALKSIGGISYSPDVDYAAMMAAAKDLEEFEALAAKRNAKIIGENLDLAEAGFADNAQLLARWQESYENASAKAQEAITVMADDVAAQIDALNSSALGMGQDFIGNLIEGIEMKAAALRQTVQNICRDAQRCAEAELQPVQQQIQLSMASLADRIDQSSGAGRSGMAANIAAAVRDALAGVSVNMNQRKVGELITDWQDRNDKSRGV